MALSEYTKTLNQIKKQVSLLEADKTRNLYSVHSIIRGDVAGLEEFERSLSMNRESSSSSLFSSVFKLKQQVGQIITRISSFIEEIRIKGVGPNYDTSISNLQKATDNIGREITLYKEKCKEEFQDLVAEEEALDEEIASLSAKFDMWGKESQNPMSKPTKILIEGKEATPLQREVMEIDKEINDIGGLTLGWDNADHQEFLKIRTQHKNKLSPGFINAMRNLLPHLDDEAVRQHFSQYEFLLKLQDKKKQVLGKWKEEKQQKKPVVIEEEKASSPMPKKKNTEVKSKIMEWKKQKEESKEEAEKKEKEKQLRLKEQDIKRKEEMERKKQMVKEYKERKEIQKTKQMYIEKYSHNRNAPSEEDLARIRDRELRLAEEKKKRVQEKLEIEEQKARQTAINNLKKQAKWAHLDSRLNKETTATINRKNAEGDKTVAQTFGGNLLHLSRRATPGWRMGV